MKYECKPRNATSNNLHELFEDDDDVDEDKDKSESDSTSE